MVVHHDDDGGGGQDRVGPEVKVIMARWILRHRLDRRPWSEGRVLPGGAECSGARGKLRQPGKEVIYLQRDVFQSLRAQRLQSVDVILWSNGWEKGVEWRGRAKRMGLPGSAMVLGSKARIVMHQSLESCHNPSRRQTSAERGQGGGGGVEKACE